MNILGIIDGAHDAGACIVRDGKVIAAISEERLNRIKVAGGFPFKSIDAVIDIAGIDYDKVDFIAIGSILTPQIYFRYIRGLRNIARLDNEYFYTEKITPKTWIADFIQFRSGITGIHPDSIIGRIEKPIIKKLIRKELPHPLRTKPLNLVEHHYSHAASAYFTWNRQRVLCVTADGVGDGLCMTFNLCDNGKINRLCSVSYPASYAFLYAMVTGLLGFRPFRHEGKLMGLSGYGKAENVKLPFPFKKINDKIIFTQKWGIKGRNYYNQLKEYNREDVSAWLQSGIEEQVVILIQEWIKKTKCRDICLSGGLFANVRLNQKIHQIKDIDSIYIFPHMGDGGLCVGGALYVWASEMFKTGDNPFPQLLENVFLGPSFTNQYIEEYLKKSRVKYKYLQNIEIEVASLLAQGNIVAKYSGRMEFGPRALGNRSILCSANNPKIKDILNFRLKRNEFMPFAPCTLYENAKEYYKNISGAEHTAQFMNISFECTNLMKELNPGAVHVDDTARPQIVKKNNSSLYRILKEYYKITGIPTLINTSFNIHEEPIVCTPQDALKTIFEGKIDYLAIEKFLVKMP